MEKGGALGKSFDAVSDSRLWIDLASTAEEIHSSFSSKYCSWGYFSCCVCDLVSVGISFHRRWEEIRWWRESKWRVEHKQWSVNTTSGTRSAGRSSPASSIATNTSVSTAAVSSEHSVIVRCTRMAVTNTGISSTNETYSSNLSTFWTVAITYVTWVSDVILRDKLIFISANMFIRKSTLLLHVQNKEPNACR